MEYWYTFKRKYQGMKKYFNRIILRKDRSVSVKGYSRP